jgi:UDP-N-acetylmuramoyl-tripeptide--D-alanyl-D-alanine ligase
MSWLSLAEIASIAGGRLIGADAAVESVVTDTRALTPGQLFVALKGPHFDGHDFAGSKEVANATGVMVSREVSISLPQIVVDDTLSALQRLAVAWREQLNLIIVGLTGSNGKTTVKELIAAILSREGPVLATRGNYNNHIGVPLTLLSIRAHHRHTVVEMGANHSGEIAALTKMTRPDVALITNAAAAHLEGFGSIEGVAKAKGEIFQGLHERGTAVINADDVYADYWRTLTGRSKRLTFGIEHAADLRWRAAGGGISCMTTPLGEVEVRLPLQGRHNMLNALAATGVAIAAGAGLGSIKIGLESVTQVRGRLVMREGKQGARLLDDSYNANPGSLAVALEVLAQQPGEHWLVLGNMGELGPNSEILHGQAGELARASGVTRLYALGSLSKAAAAAFGIGASHFDSHTALIDALSADMRAGVSLLIKGSRCMRMEAVVEALLAGDATRTPDAEQEHAA